MISFTEKSRAEAFRYMGIKGDIPENIRAAAHECEGLLGAAAVPKYHWTYADISENTGDRVTLSGHRLTLSGKDICSHLSGCFGAALMCVTLGEGVDRLLRTLQAQDMAKALAADALASAAVETVCDEAEEVIRERFPGEYFTWRFSPGYGDLPLECQGDFLAAVDAMRRVGVCLSPGGLLTPTKSVTAVVGISHDEISRKRRGCVSCTMKDRCAFRKNGGHCNG